MAWSIEYNGKHCTYKLLYVVMREYYYMYVVTSGYALEASSGNLNVSYFGSSLSDIYQCFIQVSQIFSKNLDFS